MFGALRGRIQKGFPVFIDNPTVPTQLEVVLDLLHAMRQKKAPAEAVKTLLQPKGLPDLSASSKQAALHLHAARELQLMMPDQYGDLRLTYPIRDGRPSAREAIIDAVDRLVLTSAAIEPWFGRFYGYMIARNDDGIPSDSVGRRDLCTEFNSVLPGHIERTNPINDTKLGQYVRWYTYIGLGWRDPSNRFIPDPTERFRRALPNIFCDSTRLDAAPFMASVARACPELDGGALFVEAAADHNPADRVCSRALAAALCNLHDNGLIRLDCPKDSQGWSLERGGVVRDAATLQSDRFDRVLLSSNR
jgi:hypothetical protein